MPSRVIAHVKVSRRLFAVERWAALCGLETNGVLRDFRSS
ncbi:MAG: hypothetical protein ACI9OF_001920 [Saprospiraceae bacterium]